MAKLRDPERRALILDTAMDLFAKRGFHGVSVKDIAQASDIALGSMYTYFTSKEQLVNEVYRDRKQVFRAYLSEGLDNLRGRCAHRVLWKNLTRFAIEHPVAFLFLEAQHHASYLDAESLALEASIHQFGVQFYLDLDLELEPSQAQFVVSAAFGALVQTFKASLVGRGSLNDATKAKLEELAWTIASNG